jgi:hemoglobin
MPRRPSQVSQSEPDAVEYSEPSVSLAEQIGESRIYAVVDCFYELIQKHDTLSLPFQRVTDWPLHKQRIAYFWWVSLGGSHTGNHSFAVVPKHWRAGFNEMLLGDWKALFREVVSSSLPPELAAAWMERVERIGVSLVTANQTFANQLSKMGVQILP